MERVTLLNMGEYLVRAGLIARVNKICVSCVRIDLGLTPWLPRKVNPPAAQRVTTMEKAPVPAAIVGGANGVSTPVLPLML